MDYQENYNYWTTDSYFDAATQGELRAIANDEKEIKERFHQNLAFGTGGLRGIIGAGTNRMNVYTVRKATQGLANYILKQGDAAKAKGVAIAHDSRHMSPEFSEEAALVLNGNGIKTYVFDSLRPTPELSFAVRFLQCTAGIVVTASHNPPEYNGYKVYWADGGQVPYPRDEEIILEVNQVENFADIKRAQKDEAIQMGLFNVAGPEVDDTYIENVKSQRINLEYIQKAASDLTIVYTPIHGTGNIPVRRVLAEIGFANVYVVPEQEQPDANFSTVEYPNPEDPKVFKLAVALAESKNADIIIGTDPDADRVGAMVRDDTGQFTVLTGNMTGLLLTEYILSQKKANGTLPQNGAIISTIVSTDLTSKMAQSYGVAYVDVLTGFKYIGEKIKEFETSGSHQFLFGFEESYGYLAGTYARDKDSVVATMLLCEMAAYYKLRGMTLYDGLQEIYKKYGYFKESIQSITLKGLEGLENIKKIMAGLRAKPPIAAGGSKIVECRDYQNQAIQFLGDASSSTKADTPTNLPVSDVLYYVTADGSWFCVRPSGTEPKIKIYFGVQSATNEEATAKLSQVIADVMAIVEELQK